MDKVISLVLRYIDVRGGDNTATSPPTALVANVDDPTTGSPVVIGDYIQGRPLTIDTSGLMDEDGLGTFTYQWQRSGGDNAGFIDGATGRTYTPTQADVNHTVLGRVTHTDLLGGIRTQIAFPPFDSGISGIVTNINDLPTGLAISGGLLVGQTLRADTSALVDIDGLPDESDFSYQWRADGVDIAGATGPEYMLTAAQMGAQISLNLGYTDDLNSVESITSPARGPVRGAGDNARPGSSGLAVTTAEDTPYTFGLADFPFSDGDGDSLQAVCIDSLPAPASLGELGLNGAAVSAGQVIASGAIANLVYTPALNASGDVTFTYSVSDGDEFSATANAAITIAAVNDPPTITGIPQTSVAEGGTYNFTLGGGDVDGDTLVYAITNLPDWADFSTTTGALTNKANRPNSTDVGTTTGIIISVTDGNIATPVALPAFAIEVTPPNNPPTTAGLTVTTAEETPYTFREADFPFSDLDAGDSLQAVRIGTLPASTIGSLALGGTAVTAGQVIAVGDIGPLVFTPVANVNGSTIFTFSVTDGNIATPVALPAFAIEVTPPPNNPPTTTGLTVTTAEETPYTFREADFPFSDLDAGDSLQAVRIGTLPASTIGSLALGTGATPVNMAQVIAVADIPTLVYTPVTNVNGPATFTFSVSDGTDFSATATATVTVTAVNDDPNGEVGISGIPQVGQTLTANTGGISDADGPATLSFTYQWFANDGTTNEEINGATSPTYLLTGDESGEMIRVEVSYMDANDIEGTVVSDPVGPVLAAGTVTVSIAGPSAAVTEGDPATFTVTLSGSPGSEVVVNYYSFILYSLNAKVVSHDHPTIH